MISYLPEIYPDELVYSWFCRYFVHSGCLTHKMALDDILYKRCNNPSKEFIGHLKPETHELIKNVYPIKDLVMKNTMFPQYSRFLPLERRITALNNLCNNQSDIHNILSIPPRTEDDRYLKYCPLCVEEDHKQYGETYWHRNHQLRGLHLCHKHNCLLISSNITTNSEKTFTLCPAEEYATRQNKIIPNNNKAQKYTEFVTELFISPLDLEKDVPISTILYYTMKNTPYLKSTGKTRYTKQIADDIKAFYEDIGIRNISSIYQIQRVLLGDSFNHSVVCQIAFYLGMSVKDLTEPSINKTQIEYEQSTHYMKDKNPIDWNAYDVEFAPQLEQALKHRYSSTEYTSDRPERISERLLYNKFSLSSYQLEKLPKCREVYEKYAESYEDNWARRIVWAYNKLKKEHPDCPVYWTDIRMLSGVKKKNLEKVIPLIPKYTDEVTAKVINQIIKH